MAGAQLRRPPLPGLYRPPASCRRGPAWPWHSIVSARLALGWRAGFNVSSRRRSRSGLRCIWCCCIVLVVEIEVAGSRTRRSRRTANATGKLAGTAASVIGTCRAGHHGELADSSYTCSSKIKKWLKAPLWSLMCFLLEARSLLWAIAVQCLASKGSSQQPQ